MDQPNTPRKSTEALPRHVFREHQCQNCKSIHLAIKGSTRPAGRSRLRRASCKDCGYQFVMVMVLQE
ncbi:hypothetical protein ETAA8_28440 [Anatilimnocola aggregata]|uniref:Uncharacterized protein n=1 Tax=Anatilimnocola aggregata TaxID=2528021 RepID=A0A517YC04_9BACT|nr:hypothetical protein ETAA8_28440 [Anatilimnocola aggregata]